MTRAAESISLDNKRSLDGLSVLLLLYAIIPALTPNLEAFDSNGPKFLFWSILNLVVLSIFFFSPGTLQIPQKIVKSIIHPVGLVYILFLAFALLSFLKAWNLPESFLLFSQIFTVFSTAVILSGILSSGEKYTRHLAIIMTLILMFDCLVLFGNIFLYSIGEIDRISDIKSVYSNKNIFAAVIFIKLPFALWLHFFGNGVWKKVGMLVLFGGVLSTLLLSTRAFYLGLILLSIVYLTILLIRVLQSGDKTQVRSIFQFSGVIVIAIVLMYGIQALFYPETTDEFARTVVQRVEMINTRVSSAKSRLETWGFSKEMIRKEPLLGVGLGNWKIAELEYESPAREDFEYMLRNHNDFIEVTAETGIPGGISYFLLIIIPVGLFIHALFSQGRRNSISLLFLAATGAVCYSFDAFFNFPITRPEVQILFAFFIAAAVSSSFDDDNKNKVPGRSAGQILIVLLLIISFFATFILYKNFVSLRFQRIAHEEAESGFFNHSADEMIAGFPSIPAINAGGEPISVTKSRYLIHEGRFEEAIRLLRNSNSSPHDGRFELLTMIAFDKMNNPDSTLFYAKKVLERKPDYYQAIEKICQIRQEAGDYKSPVTLLSKVIQKDPANLKALEYRARCFFFQKEYQGCINDLNQVIRVDSLNSMLINIRGICYNALNDDSSACRDFTRAKNLGSREAEDNYFRVCGKTQSGAKKH